MVLFQSSRGGIDDSLMRNRRGGFVLSDYFVLWGSDEECENFAFPGRQSSLLNLQARIGLGLQVNEFFYMIIASIPYKFPFLLYIPDKLEAIQYDVSSSPYAVNVPIFDLLWPGSLDLNYCYYYLTKRMMSLVSGF